MEVEGCSVEDVETAVGGCCCEEGFFRIVAAEGLRETWRRLEALGRGTCVGILGAIGEHGRGQTVHS